MPPKVFAKAQRQSALVFAGAAQPPAAVGALVVAFALAKAGNFLQVARVALAKKARRRAPRVHLILLETIQAFFAGKKSARPSRVYSLPALFVFLRTVSAAFCVVGFCSPRLARAVCSLPALFVSLCPPARARAVFL